MKTRLPKYPEKPGRKPKQKTNIGDTHSLSLREVLNILNLVINYKDVDQFTFYDATTRELSFTYPRDMDCRNPFDALRAAGKLDADFQAKALAHLKNL